MGASRPASHRVLWPTALLSAHACFCVTWVATSSLPAPRAVAAGSGTFSGWRRSGSWAWPACQAIGLLPAVVIEMGSSVKRSSAVLVLSAQGAPAREETAGKRTLVLLAPQAIPRAGSQCSKPARRRYCPYADPFHSPLRPRLSRLAPATAPAAPAPTRARRRPEASDQPHSRAATRRRALPFPELGALLLVAGVLNLWALDRNGWANEYYSAAVRSMSSSWHNFLYGSFDPSGRHDGRQAAARALGPGALGPGLRLPLAEHARPAGADGRRDRRAGLRPHAPRLGRTAASSAGLVLASRRRSPSRSRATTTPTRCWSCAASRRCGSWCARCRTAARAGSCSRASASASASRRRWARRCSSCPRSSRRGCGSRRAAGSPRVRQLLAGGAAMVAVGGAWPLLMALTPASSRPWISGTSDNSIWSLILDYNGLGRLDGQAGGPQAMGGAGGAGRSTTFGGATGPLRLLNDGLGGQAGWLLGFAVVAIVALVASRLRRADARTGWLVAAGGAFLTSAVAFSSAQGIFHPYYVAQLAPFTAALVGAGSGWFLSRHRAAGIGAAAGPGGRCGDRAARAPQPPRSAHVAAGRPARRRRGDGRRPRRGPRAAARRRPRGRARAAAARPRELGRADARPRHQRHVPRRRPVAGPASAAAAAAAAAARRRWPRRRRLRRSPAPGAAGRRRPGPGSRLGGGAPGAGGAGGGPAAAASVATPPG